MNKTESAGVGSLVGILIIAITLSVFYYLMLDNFIIIVEQFHYDLKPVKDNIFWFVVGWDILASISGGIKVYHYARRGKDING